MKKVLSFIMAIIILFSLSFSAYADSAEDSQSHVKDVTVIFSEHTPFSLSEMEKITAVLSGDDVTDGFDIRCLFGHDYQTDYVNTITHKVNIHSPRCLSETFEVKICSRCGKTVTELLYSNYIVCCPED